MPHKPGTHLDGIRAIEDLKGRCVVDPDTACWHLRSANGRQLPRTETAYVWLHGVGVISAKRGAWLLRNGELPAPGKRVFAICKSPHDCVNTSHLRALTTAEYGQHLRRTGRLRGDARRMVLNRVVGSRRAKLTPETAQWARESEQSTADVAHGLLVSESLVTKVRRGAKWKPKAASNVFDWSPA